MLTKKLFWGLVLSLSFVSINSVSFPVYAGEKFIKNGETNENIKWYSYNNGIREANKQNKKIIIDFYTNWCIYCKKMDENYNKLAEEINKNYIAIKINCESNNLITYKGKKITEKQLAIDMAINSYPTIVFFDSDNYFLDSIDGFLPKTEFNLKLKEISKIATIKNDKNRKLYDAIENNDIKLINKLIASGVKVNQNINLSKFDKSLSPLMYASETNKIEVVKLLLEKGANIDAKNPGSATALMYALFNKNNEIAQLLINNNANVNEKDFNGYTALFLTSDSKLVNLLIAKGADVNAKTVDSFTPLMLSAYYSYKDMVELLLKNRADIDVKNLQGSTALIIAVEMGNKEITEMLIKNGADINVKDKKNRTALTLALKNGDKELAELLISKGAKYDLFELSQTLLNEPKN